MTAMVGEPAPDFSGNAVVDRGENFKQLNLLDYRGKWLVLFFYPLDFTFVCPTEIRGFQRRKEEFDTLGAEIIGCSTDSVYSHKAWMERPRTKGGIDRLDFPLIGDTNLKMARDYGVLIEDQGIALRGTFIIDPDGKLRHATINDTGVGRAVDETVRNLQALQTGELCPQNWKPGKRTLGKA